MKIDRVHIEHYKSLSNVTVEMHPRVTVLVGPNGSGKSNFVDALELMRDLGQGDLTRAMDKRGGFQRMIENDQDRFDNAICNLFGDDQYVSFSITKDGFSLKSSSTTSIRKAVIQWRFPKFTPSLLRPIESITRLDSLDEDLKNWAAIFQKNADAFNRVKEALRVVLPDLNDVQITPAGNSYLIPTFHFKIENGIEKSFDAAQLSDGTLHIFGLLLTLYQSPAPEVIVIEEPEHYVHPAVLALLAECIQEVSEITQIILTTHSPHLVGLFKTENIRAVQSINGKTHIAPIKNSQLTAIKNGWIGLEEFMSSEGLYPELHDD